MFRRTFKALQHRNYRLFFFGQLISLVGTWMQWTAQQWLVYELTRSKILLGLVAACGTTPIFLLAIFAGTAADRKSKRTILLYTQTIMMLSAFVLGVLVLLEAVQIWHIALFAFLTGIAGSFDMPTRQAFLIELVGKDEVMNAVGLNSSIFNGARVIGPALAGLCMAEVGIGWCFLLNGVSFAAILYGLLQMRLEPRLLQEARTSSLWKEVLDVLTFVYHRKSMVFLLGLVTVMGIFGWSFQILIPAFAKDVLQVGERSYGLLLTWGGIGALLAALSVATISRSDQVWKIVFAGMLLSSLSSAVFSWSRNYGLSAITFAIALYGITAFFAAANTFLQVSVPDDLQGRIMGLWTLVFGGTMQIGNLLMGVLGEVIGVQWAVFLGAAVCFLAMMAMIASRLVQKTAFQRWGGFA